MPKILIVSLSRILEDPRVLRQQEALRVENHLVIGGYPPFPENSIAIELFPVPSKVLLMACGILSLIGFHAVTEKILFQVKRNSLELVRGIPHVDMIIVNDITSMPYVIEYRKQTGQPDVPVYLDLHEYSPMEGSSPSCRLIKNRLKKYLCKKYIHEADILSTVSSGIKVLYEKMAKCEVYVIPNAPKFTNITPTTVDSEKIELVYHGGFGPGRDIHGMVEAIRLLGKPYEMHFYLVGGEEDKMKIEEASEGLRVFFHDPVSPDKIPETIAKHDIGVHLLKSDNLNNKYALPNKLFEYLQARLAIVSSPSEEMGDFIKSNRIGVVAAKCDAQHLAAAIKSVTVSDIIEYKKNSNKAAAEFCAEKYFPITKKLVQMGLST